MRPYMTATRASLALALLVTALAGCASDVDVTAPAPNAPSLARSPNGGAIAALVVSPDSVTGGTTVQGTVTLGSAAPAKGTTVALASSDPTVATVPATVTVPRGQTSATFPIATKPSIGATVTITASQGRSAQSASLSVVAPMLASVTLSPATLAVHATGQGTVTLSGPAPADLLIAVTSSSAAVQVPALVTIFAGTTQASFDVLALEARSVTITAELWGWTRSAVLTTY